MVRRQSFVVSPRIARGFRVPQSLRVASSCRLGGRTVISTSSKASKANSAREDRSKQFLRVGQLSLVLSPHALNEIEPFLLPRGPQGERRQGHVAHTPVDHPALHAIVGNFE